MKCEKFEQQMQWLLDCRRQPEIDSRLIAHAQGCADCRQQLKAHEMLVDGMTKLELPPMSADFSHQVVGEVLRPRLSLRNISIAAGLLAVAASLLIAAVVLRGNIVPRGNSQNSDEIANFQPVQPNSPTIKSQNVEVALEVGPAGTTDLASDELTQQYEQMLESWTQQMPALSMEQMKSVDQWPEGLRPVVSSFGSAWEVLRLSLPIGQSRSTDEPQTENDAKKDPLAQKDLG